MISFKLTNNEKEKIEKQLKIINNMANSVKNSMYGERHQINRLSRFKSLLYNVDKDLLYYMNKYKMIFPSIQMGVGIRGLEKQYKLNEG